MINLENKKVLIMGLGRFGGGVGAARFAVEHGANVTITDNSTTEQLANAIEALADLDITYHLGGHYRQDFIESDLIIVNPAVSPENEFLQIAKENSIPLTTEMNLLWQNTQATKIGVTGSNGKSTTTAMLYHILNECIHDRNIWLGGNIGAGSLLAQIDKIAADDILVLELSSFQLEELAKCAVSPHIAVVTNISPNHLDRHVTMENYITAKQNILKFQGEDDFAILCGEDEQLASWSEIGPGQKSFYYKPEKDITLNVPGSHNQLNAAGAIAAAEKAGVSHEECLEALKLFSGLEHRLEMVRNIDGVKYYNDSIATTPESVIAAIEAFADNKILIMGGYDKGIEFTELAATIAGNNVKAVVLIGQTAEKLENEINQAAKSSCSKVVTAKCDTFENAITKANEFADDGDVVLLSPACASYGMFINFQQRGNEFKRIIESINS